VHANAIARQSAAHEDDEPVVPAHSAPSVCERVDAELELLSFANWRSHGQPG